MKRGLKEIKMQNIYFFIKKTGGIIASFLKKIKINLKPGNLGAILRTNAVLLCNNTIDIFNPNVIRSSAG
ncbi:MAG: hypothetical protein ACE19P_00220 [Candidatus Karelsulcia muelleri]